MPEALLVCQPECVSNAHCTSLDDGQCPRIDGGSQLRMEWIAVNDLARCVCDEATNIGADATIASALAR